jgi:hypothetical protein
VAKVSQNTYEDASKHWLNKSLNMTPSQDSSADASKLMANNPMYASNLITYPPPPPKQGYWEVAAEPSRKRAFMETPVDTPMGSRLGLDEVPAGGGVGGYNFPVDPTDWRAMRQAERAARGRQILGAGVEGRQAQEGFDRWTSEVLRAEGRQHRGPYFPKTRALLEKYKVGARAKDFAKKVGLKIVKGAIPAAALGALSGGVGYGVGHAAGQRTERTQALNNELADMHRRVNAAKMPDSAFTTTPRKSIPMTRLKPAIKRLEDKHVTWAPRNNRFAAREW